MQTDSSVVFEFVNRIFLDYSPMYHQIKKIAERDIGQELLDKVKDFLEKRKKEGIKLDKLEKIDIDDPSTVSDEGINDIVDAFIHMRSTSTLNQLDKKSINEILILFNQWITIGKLNPSTIPIDALSFPAGKTMDLEEQIMQLEPAFVKDNPLYPSNTQKNIYSSVSDTYGTLQGFDANLVAAGNPFYHVSEYKMQRQSNL